MKKVELLKEKEKLELNRKVVLANTETLLNLYKKKMDNMDKRAIKEYGNVIFKLLDCLACYEKPNDWYLGFYLL